MPSFSQELVTLALQKSVLQTLLSDAKFQTKGTPHALIEKILGILTTDSPKTYFFWRTSFKAKQFLYMLYQTVFYGTPELNQFLSSTSLDEQKKQGLKAATELELNIPSSASTAEINEYLEKITMELGNHQSAPPSHW